jgi:hypothetical protein
MTSKIKADDLLNNAIQAHADGYRCFMDGDGNKASFYAGMLSAYMTLLTEYFDKNEDKILAIIDKANKRINHSNF